jgi:RNA recognition motif-containing protein
MTDNAAAAPAAATGATTSIDDYPHKVFAGNLSFKTTEDELKEFFSSAGNVVKVNIITRGTRSLGYGFVAFSSQEECHAAVEKLHKKILGEREINIEVAKPKAELEAAKKERAAQRRRKPYKKKKPVKAKEGAAQETGAEKAEGGENKTTKSKRKPKKKKIFSKREPKPRREPTGQPSKTTVFVANLPFSLTDETFAAVFKEYKVKSAKVVVRRGTGRSKGFGFVELETEEEQTRLLSAPPLVSEGRELNIKVALSEEKTAETVAEASAEAQPQA